jgi:hypothetical protein
MKALLILGAIAGSLVGAQASAATYFAACQSCTGGAQGSAWYAAAVNLGIANNAQEDDLLVICKDLNPSLSSVAEYVVVSDPVIDASDIQWTYTQGSDVSCADLGIE